VRMDADARRVTLTTAIDPAAPVVLGDGRRLQPAGAGARRSR